MVAMTYEGVNYYCGRHVPTLLLVSFQQMVVIMEMHYLMMMMIQPPV